MSSLPPAESEPSPVASLQVPSPAVGDASGTRGDSVLPVSQNPSEVSLPSLSDLNIAKEGREGEEQEALESHEVIELQVFSERKAWIEDKVKYLEQMPPVEVFVGLDAVKSSAEEVPGLPTRAELQQWLVEHDRIERETDIFDSGEFKNIKKFTKAASKRNLSPEDTDLIELTLTTILALDKLLHLLRDRSDNLDLLGTRLTWEEHRIGAWQDRRKVLEDMQTFLATRARWSPSAYEDIVPTPEEKPRVRRGSAASTMSVMSDATTARPGFSRAARFKQAELLSRDAAQFGARVSALRHSKIAAAGKALDKLIDDSRKPVPDELLDEQDKVEEQGINEMENIGKFAMNVVMQWRKADEIYVETSKDHTAAQTLLDDIETALQQHPTSRLSATFGSRADALVRRLVLRGDPAASYSTLPRPLHPLFPDQAQANKELAEILSEEVSDANALARKAESIAKEYRAHWESVRRVESLVDSAKGTQAGLKTILERLKNGVPSDRGDGTPPNLTSEVCLDPARHAAFLASLPSIAKELQQYSSKTDELLQISRSALLAIERPSVNATFKRDANTAFRNLAGERARAQQLCADVQRRVSALLAARKVWDAIGERAKELEIFSRDVGAAMDDNRWKQQTGGGGAPLTPESPASTLQQISTPPADVRQRLDDISGSIASTVEAPLAALPKNIDASLLDWLTKGSIELKGLFAQARQSSSLLDDVKRQASVMSAVRDEVYGLSTEIEDAGLLLDSTVENILNGKLVDPSSKEEVTVVADVQRLNNTIQALSENLSGRVVFIADRTGPSAPLLSALKGVSHLKDPTSWPTIDTSAFIVPFQLASVDDAVRTDSNFYVMRLSGQMQSLKQKVCHLQLAHQSKAVDKALSATLSDIQHVEHELAEHRTILASVGQDENTLQALDNVARAADALCQARRIEIARSFSPIRDLLRQMECAPGAHDSAIRERLLSTRSRAIDDAETRFKIWIDDAESFKVHIAEDLRQEQERLERERLAEVQRLKAEAERLEAERLEKERLEQERLEKEQLAEQRIRAEQARLEAERCERERLQRERLEAERLAEEARLEAERLEKDRLERERLEKELAAEEARLAAERAEQERLESERLEAERLAEEARLQAERVEKDRLERERLEQELAAEEARLAAERAEQERLERERLEQERLEKERAAEEERLRAEADRLEQERLMRERIAEQERLRAEQERLEGERLERERLETERLESERIAAEERVRAEAELVEAERVERERQEQERLERARVERERKEQERLEMERVAEEDRIRAEEARLAAERVERDEQERLKREQQAQEELARERLANERMETERLDREGFEKQEQGRAQRGKAETERLRRLRLAEEAVLAQEAPSGSGNPQNGELPVETDVFGIRSEPFASPSRVTKELTELHTHIVSLRKRLRSIGLNDAARPSGSSGDLPTQARHDKMDAAFQALSSEVVKLPPSVEIASINVELKSLRSEIEASAEMMQRICMLVDFRKATEACDFALSDLLEHIDSYPAGPPGPLLAAHKTVASLSPEEQLSSRLQFTQGQVEHLNACFAVVAGDPRATAEHSRVLQTWSELQEMGHDLVAGTGRKSRPGSVSSSGRNSTASMLSSRSSSSVKKVGYPNLSAGAPSRGRFLSPAHASSRRVVSGTSGSRHNSRSSSRMSVDAASRSVSGPTFSLDSSLHKPTFASRQRNTSLSSNSSNILGTPLRTTSGTPLQPRSSRSRIPRMSSPTFSEMSTLSRSALSPSRSSNSTSMSSWARAPPRPSFSTLPRMSTPPKRQRAPIPKKEYVANPKNKLDMAVGEVVNRMPVNINIEVVADTWKDQSGKYWIGDQDPKLCFCRILRSQTVMVRVGGGWTELSKFIKNHFADHFRLLPDSSPGLSTVGSKEPKWISSATLLESRDRESGTPPPPPRTPEPRGPFVPTFSLITPDGQSPKSLKSTPSSGGSPLTGLQFMRRVEEVEFPLTPSKAPKVRPRQSTSHTPSRNTIWRP